MTPEDWACELTREMQIGGEFAWSRIVNLVKKIQAEASAKNWDVIRDAYEEGVKEGKKAAPDSPPASRGS